MKRKAIRMPPPSDPAEREALLERGRKARAEEEQYKEATVQQAREILEERKILQEIMGALKHARIERSISLEDLGRKINIRIEELTDLENSPNAHPELYTLQKIAKAIGVEIAITVK